MNTSINNVKSDYPFGMLMPGRSISTTAYRFGFNGKENDNEVKGNFNSVDFGARIYDSRLGRWLSLDPLQKKYPNMSPFSFTANSPIRFVEYDGKDFGVVIDHSTHTILITATIYTISPKTYNEALSAACNWNNLSNNTVNISGQVYTVTVNITVEPDKGSNSNDKFKNAHIASENNPEGNTYNGSVNGFSNDKGFGTTLGKSMTALNSKEGKPLEAGQSDGKNISMPRWNIEGSRSAFYAPGAIPYSVDHEFGHLLGLDDPENKYYTPGGVMDYSGPYAPNLGDLINVIKYALDGSQNGKANVTTTNQANNETDNRLIKSSDVE